MVRIHDLRAPSSPVGLPPFQTKITTALLSSQVSTENPPRDVDAVADTGPVGWKAVDSDHSGEEAQAVEAGKAIETLAERRLQATHSEDLRRETKEKRAEGKGG